MRKLKESIKFIRSIKSIRSVDPCGALCLRQLELPNYGINDLSIIEFFNLKSLNFKLKGFAWLYNL